MHREKVLNQFSLFAETEDVGLSCFLEEGFSPVVLKLLNPGVGSLFSRQGFILFILYILVCGPFDCPSAGPSPVSTPW